MVLHYRKAGYLDYWSRVLESGINISDRRDNTKEVMYSVRHFLSYEGDNLQHMGKSLGDIDNGQRNYVWKP